MIVDVLTIFALILGPTLAVLITKHFEKKREAQRRKWEIFRDLMCYRSDGVSQGFVSSLNLLRVEFHNDESVLAAWESLYEHFCKAEPVEDDHKKRFLDEREKLKAKLLKKVAQSLGIKIDGLDLLQNGYFPERWEWDEKDQREMREKFIEVLDGNRRFPVQISNIPNTQNDATSDYP